MSACCGTAAPELAFERVLRQPLRLAQPANHLLAETVAAALEAMAGTDWVATPRDKVVGFHGGALDICRRAGFTPRIVQRARQIHTVKALVASGIGVAFVPENPLESATVGVMLKPVTVAGSADGLAVDLLMAWNPRRQTPTRDRFLAVVREVLAQHGGAAYRAVRKNPSPARNISNPKPNGTPPYSRTTPS